MSLPTLDNMSPAELRDLAERAKNAADAQEKKEREAREAQRIASGPKGTDSTQFFFNKEKRRVEYNVSRFQDVGEMTFNAILDQVFRFGSTWGDSGGFVDLINAVAADADKRRGQVRK